MILIFSLRNDNSTHDVIELIPKKIPICVIYVDEVFNIPKFKICFENDNKPSIIINNKTVKVVWLRKSFKTEYIDNLKIFRENENRTERKFLKKEWTKIYENFTYILKYCPNIKIIGGSKYSNFNDPIKLEILYLAGIVGLNIPKTIFSNYLPKKNDNLLITKPIGEFAFIEDFNSEVFGLYTCKINQLYNNFAPSLFQEFIQKKADIRVFFLDNQIYASAIFQSEKGTSDYRIYDLENLPSWLRFNMPNEIEEKIKELMFLINANFGVLDFLLTNEEKLIFLEINLGGQFGDMSYNCKYNLERIFADKLISFYEK